jgi:hypothetical protein
MKHQIRFCDQDIITKIDDVIELALIGILFVTGIYGFLTGFFPSLWIFGS